MLKNPEEFKKKVREYVQKYAKESDVKNTTNDKEESDDDETLSNASESSNDLNEFSLDNMED